MVFLPFYLPNSIFMVKPRLGLSAIVLWIVTQALWLQQGYQLEMLGHSSFIPGLWIPSLLFFMSNVWILGIVVLDVGLGRNSTSSQVKKIQ
jgi:phosphatidylinositol glycan class M